MKKEKEKELTAEEKTKAERSELNLLISGGMKFEVEGPDNVSVRKGLKKLFSRGRTGGKKIYRFTIKEPTLSVLDRLAVEQIDLNIDETIMKGEKGLSEAKRLALDNAHRLARIVAIAVMGQEYMMPVASKGEYCHYRPDERGLSDLAEFFFNNIQPSRLMQLAVRINTISNLGDFCNSIRLLSANRTTMPDLIESKEG